MRAEFHRLVRNLDEMATRWGGRDEENTKSNTQAGIYASHLKRLLEACQNDTNFRFDFYDHNGFTLDPQNYASPTYAATPQVRSRSIAHERSLARSHGRNNSFNSSQSTLSPRHLPPSEMTRNTAMPSPSEYERHHPRMPNAHVISPTVPPPPMYPSPQVPASYLSHTPSQYQPNGNAVAIPDPSLAPYGAAGATSNHQSLQDQSLLNLSDAFMDSHFLDMDRVITFEDANFFLPGDAFRWQ
jgi:hypothetical protein